MQFFILLTGWLLELQEGVSFLVNAFGLPGIFIAAVIGNATLFLGVPFELILVIFMFASNEIPLLIAIVAGLGAGIGELTGYAIGYAGRIAMQKAKKGKEELFEKLQKWIDKRGVIAVFLLSLVPIPFDLVGIACGIAKMHIGKFYLAAFAGKTARYAIVLYAAFFGIELALGFFGVAA